MKKVDLRKPEWLQLPETWEAAVAAKASSAWASSWGASSCRWWPQPRKHMNLKRPCICATSNGPSSSMC